MDPSTTTSVTRRAARVRRRLGDGSVVALIPGSLSCIGMVTDLFERMSPDSRRLRFFAAMPRVQPWMVRRLCDVDHRDHIQWLTVVEGEAIGEVTLARPADGAGPAEVALAVRDDWHRRGVGRLLLEVAGVLAAHRGFGPVHCDVLPENKASSALFASLGFRLRLSDGVLSGVGPLPAWSGHAALAGALRCHADAAAAWDRRPSTEELAVAA
jgi:GNAT superfamily N-acetyltransferase